MVKTPTTMISNPVSLLIVLLLFTKPIISKATTSTITASPTPSASPDYTDDETFTSAILNSTDVYRKEHNASSISWNDTLASFAKDYLSSDAVGDSCKFAHSGGPYGENLAIGYGNATAAVEAWGDEGEKYNYGKPGFSEDTGHFTQLVWKNTTDVGCGRRLCGDNKGWYVVCEYWPRGNVIGAFKDEVDKPVNSASGIIVLSKLLSVATAGVIFWMLL
ncbi:PR-1-like protein [Xylaria venustula]|nr:PR-1-like protein [Xylaria venustula]